MDPENTTKGNDRRSQTCGKNNSIFFFGLYRYVIKFFHKYNCIRTSLTAAVASGPRSVINSVTYFGSV